MAVGKGFNKLVGIAEQVAFDTAVAPTGYMEFTEEAIVVEKEEIISAGIRGSAGVARRMLGRINVNGTLSFEVFPQGAIGTILKHAMGTVATTQPDAGGNPTVYDHEFTLADELPEHGLTFTIDRDIAQKEYYGCKISQLEMTVDSAGLLMCTITVIGKNVSSATTFSPTFPEQNPFIFTQGKLEIDSTETEISNFTITLNNNLREDRYGIKNSGSRFQVERLGKREVTGSFNRPYENDTVYDDFIAGTPAVLKLTFESTVIAGGDGSYNYKLVLEMPVAYYNSFTPGTGGAEMGDHTIPFRAIEKITATTAKEMKITLTNDDTSY